MKGAFTDCAHCLTHGYKLDSSAIKIVKDKHELGEKNKILDLTLVGLLPMTKAGSFGLRLTNTTCSIQRYRIQLEWAIFDFLHVLFNYNPGTCFVRILCCYCIIFSSP